MKRRSAPLYGPCASGRTLRVFYVSSLHNCCFVHGCSGNQCMRVNAAGTLMLCLSSKHFKRFRHPVARLKLVLCSRRLFAV